MSQGKIAEQGTYDELVTKEGSVFKALMEWYHGEESDSELEPGNDEKKDTEGHTEAAEVVGGESSDEEARLGELTESAVATEQARPARTSPNRSSKDLRKSKDLAPLAAAAARCRRRRGDQGQDGQHRHR